MIESADETQAVNLFFAKWMANRKLRPASPRQSLQSNRANARVSSVASLR